MTKIAAIYARVSSKKQKDEETIHSQIEALRQYAKDNGFSIPNGWEFKDEGYTGAVLERPGLDELRDIASEGNLDLILIYSPDRLSRKYAYQLLLQDEFAKHGVELIFLKCPAATTPEEQFALHFHGIFAEYERAQIAERCRRGRLYKAKQGDSSVLPSLPYGYIRTRHLKSTQYCIDEGKSIIVKEMFRLYTKEQISLKGIAKHLNSKGILPPKKGQKWDERTVGRILGNTTYTGIAYFGKTEKSEGVSEKIIRGKKDRFAKPRYARKARPKENWFEIRVPGFIDEIEFLYAQERLKKNKELAARRTKVPALLQGLLVCAKCGEPYYKKTRMSGKNKKKIEYYCCRTNISRELKNCGNRVFHCKDLDDIIWNEIIGLVRDPNLIEQEINRRLEHNQEAEKKKTERSNLEKELSQINKARDKLLDAYQDGESIGLNDLRTRLEKLNGRKKAIENDLKMVEDLRMQDERGEDLKLALRGFLDALTTSSEELTIKEKQKAVRLIIDEVLISEKFIKIKHCIPLPRVTRENSPLPDVVMECGA